MNEFEARDYILSQKINDSQGLKKLAEEVLSKFNYDYGAAPRSVGAFLAVTGDFFCKEMGMTGFQAGCLMWDFILGFNYKNNKCGLRLLDYDDLLFPQYLHNFKEVPKETWDKVVKQAQKYLDENYMYTCASIIEYWKYIVSGKIPEGITIVDY